MLQATLKYMRKGTVADDDNIMLNELFSKFILILFFYTSSSSSY
jgi:hypothetical protein